MSNADDGDVDYDYVYAYTNGVVAIVVIVAIMHVVVDVCSTLWLCECILVLYVMQGVDFISWWFQHMKLPQKGREMKLLIWIKAE
jgi:hypothetical protein